MKKIYEKQNLDITGGFVDIKYASDTNKILADYSATIYDNGFKEASLTIRVQNVDVDEFELNSFIDELKSVKDEIEGKEFCPFQDKVANSFARLLEVPALYNFLELKQSDFCFSTFDEIILPQYGVGKTTEEVIDLIKAKRKNLVDERKRISEQLRVNGEMIVEVDRQLIGVKPRKL